MSTDRPGVHCCEGPGSFTLLSLEVDGREAPLIEGSLVIDYSATGESQWAIVGVWPGVPATGDLGAVRVVVRTDVGCCRGDATARAAPPERSRYGLVSMMLLDGIGDLACRCPDGC